MNLEPFRSASTSFNSITYSSSYVPTADVNLADQNIGRI